MSARVLLVSKDPLALAGISHAIQSQLPPVTVETASSADRALILVATIDFDVIVFPAPMPDIDVILFLKEVKSLRPQSMALVAGDPGDEHLRHTAIRYGADGFIEQPI